MTTTSLLVLSCLLVGDPVSRPVGMVARIDGQASVQRAEEERLIVLTKKKFNYYLLAGDRLTVAPESKVRVVFFADDHWEDLGPGTFLVKPKQCRGQDPSSKMTRLAIDRYSSPTVKAGFAVIRRGSGRGAGALLRADRPGNNRQASSAPRVAPVRGEKTTSDRPRLSWFSGEADRFVVRIKRAGTGSLVWERTVAKPFIEFPENEPSLKRNRGYFWEIDRLVSGGEAESLWRSQFTVGCSVPEQELAAIEKLAASDQPFDLFLAIASYEELGMYGRVIPVCERLTAIASQNAASWRLLSEFYDRAGRVQDAEKARAQGVALGSSEQ